MTAAKGKGLKWSTNRSPLWELDEGLKVVSTDDEDDNKMVTTQMGPNEAIAIKWNLSDSNRDQ